MRFLFKKNKTSAPAPGRQLPFVGAFSEYVDTRMRRFAAWLGTLDQTLSPRARKRYFFVFMAVMCLFSASMLSGALWPSSSGPVHFAPGSITPTNSTRLPDSLNVELLRVLADTSSNPSPDSSSIDSVNEK